ncbi:MAG TPA: family 16 glycosylhydrolase, partial [Cyclobacteriaceae bacterium]|nr:family 16 glycosylhydrolase [Cyclobacteriaceae bacterium]
MLAVLTFCSACTNQSVTVPMVYTYDVSQTRTTGASEFNFAIALDKTSASDVSFHYTTQGGTAEAGKDFVSNSGVLVVPAGSLTGSIKVTVTGDSIRKPNQDFSIELSEPKNCTFQRNQIKGTLVNENGSYFPVDNTGYSTPDLYNGYSLVWNDEFSGKSINQNYWSFENGNQDGWGNHELEYYTSRMQNAFVSQGNLIIEARAETFSGSNFTSARMITKGKKSFRYGRIDIRAKLPQGKGIWPALWMLGENIDAAGWPACGEVDMMELLGQEPNKIYGTLHWGSTPSSHQSYGTSSVLSAGTFADSFHVFSMVWSQTSIEFLVDD